MVYDGVAVNILSVVYRAPSRFLKNVDLCSEVIRAKSGRLRSMMIIWDGFIFQQGVLDYILAFMSNSRRAR